jgi:hypothetical protein
MPVVALFEEGSGLKGFLYGHHALCFTRADPRVAFRRALRYISTQHDSLARMRALGAQPSPVMEPELDRWLPGVKAESDLEVTLSRWLAGMIDAECDSDRVAERLTAVWEANRSLAGMVASLLDKKPLCSALDVECDIVRLARLLRAVGSCDHEVFSRIWRCTSKDELRRKVDEEHDIGRVGQFLAYMCGQADPACAVDAGRTVVQWGSALFSWAELTEREHLTSTNALHAKMAADASREHHGIFVRCLRLIADIPEHERRTFAVVPRDEPARCVR